MSDTHEEAAPDTLNVGTGAAAIESLLSDDIPEEQEEHVEESEDQEELETSDEVEETEEVEEGDSSEEEEQEEEEDASEPDIETYEVKIDGETSTVSLDEALKGYQRQQTFTKRMQALAEEKRKFSEEQQSATQTRQEYLDKLALVDKALGLDESEPNWDEVKSQNPKKYPELRAAWIERRDQVAGLKAEQERVREEIQRQFDAEQARRLAEETQKLEAVIPEWAADPEVKRAEQGEMVQFAQTTYGFTPEDLGTVVDHRIVLLLRDAMMYHDGVSKSEKAKDVAKKTRKKSGTLEPGSKAKSKGKSKSRTAKSRKKLAETGRVDDAAAVLMDMLG